MLLRQRRKIQKLLYQQQGITMMGTLFKVLLGFSLLFSSMVNANSPAHFTLQSADFKPLSTLPRTFTCDGEDVSPALSWSNLPPKTQSLVLILSDADAPNGTFYHWVLYNIPPIITSIPTGVDPHAIGISSGRNSWEMLGYRGPCPPQNASHRYIFSLYALDAALSIKPGVDAVSIIKRITPRTIEKTELVVTYQRKS